MTRLAAFSGLLLLTVAAHAECSAALSQKVTAAQHRLDAFHPDKPGQLRVVAANGAEFSAAEVRWMEGQLHAAAQACGQGNESAASAALADVEALLQTHQRTT